MMKYRVPDRLGTCIIGRYVTDMWKYNYKYRVPDMYPIVSILTSETNRNWHSNFRMDKRLTEIIINM